MSDAIAISACRCRISWEPAEPKYDSRTMMIDDSLWATSHRNATFEFRFCVKFNLTSWLLDPWTKWTACSKTCGPGIATRQRNCAVGSCIQRQTKPCFLKSCVSSGKNLQSKNDVCISSLFLHEEDRFEQWQVWSECSATCGPGQRRRIRKCTSGTCQESTQTCSIKPCEGSGYFLNDDYWKSASCEKRRSHLSSEYLLL